MKTLRDKIKNYGEHAEFGAVTYYYDEDDYDYVSSCIIYPLDDENGYFTTDRLYDFYSEVEKFEINIDDFETIVTQENDVQFFINFDDK